MPAPRPTRALLALALLLLAPSARAQEIAVAPTDPTGVYPVGGTAGWRVEFKPAPSTATAPAIAPPAELAYVLKKNGLTVVKEGTVPLTNGAGTLSAPLDEPGTSLLAEFKAMAGGKAVRGLGGAVAAPTGVKPSAPPPADFDAFWKAKLADLAAVPPNPQLEPADAGQPAGGKKQPVEYYKLTLDNIRGTKVYGQLAKPKADGPAGKGLKGDGKLPALLVAQYAGVYGLPKSNVVPRAEQGWLALNIMAHDLPFDRPKEFYDQQAAGPLKDYVAIGGDDRETSYFLRMGLGCYRAAEYLATRPDWDGRTLVVMGTSQGGFQAFVAAGLHPKVSAMLANVPAGCDPTGREAGRAAGWPYWQSMAKGKDPAKVRETSRYYDAVNFARLGTCPALVSCGLIDETCPPTAVLAACDVRAGKTETVILPKSNHHGTGNAQAAYYARAEQWLKSLARGEGPPPAEPGSKTGAAR